MPLDVPSLIVGLIVGIILGILICRTGGGFR
jgi:flagellar biosynthesis protein FliQ